MKTADSERRWDNKENNIEALEKEGFTFKYNKDNYTVLLREEGKPKVDFYVSRNKWKAILKNKRGKTYVKYFTGDTRSFINWYKKQSA
jgi:hypothetical protein